MTTQTENVVYTNEVILKGFIVHKYEAAKATILTIATNKGYSSPPDYPKVVCFDESREKAKDFNKGDNITVIGNVQSSKRRRKDNPKITFYSQSIFAEDIMESQNVLEAEFGVEGESYGDPLNQGKFAGTVTQISSPVEGLIRLTVKTIKNNRVSFVAMTFFTQEVGKVLENIRVNDNVCALASIQTRKKKSKGEVRHYENVVVHDLQKIS